MNLAWFSWFLVVFSGFCWTVVYIDSIRLGFRDSTYAIPFWALAFNVAWELLQAVLEYQKSGFVLQVGITSVWLLLDCVIMYTYFRFGKKYSPQHVKSWFFVWSILVLITAFILQNAFLSEFGFYAGRKYAAFLQNLLMSVLFIGMLVNRGSSEGQSLTIAVSKWLGTLAPAITYGILGSEGTRPSLLVLVIGGFCSLFDLIYIGMLAHTKAREKHG